MGQFGIYISQVIREYKAMGMSTKPAGVAIAYRKTDGSFGSKQRVTRRSGEQPVSEKRDLASIQHETRQAGKLFLVDELAGGKFELHIPLLVSWNGKLIDHRF